MIGAFSRSRWLTSAFWNARASASGSRVRKVTALRFSIRSKRSGKGAAAKPSSAAMVAGSHSGGA
jgi:hypothetical protein